MKRLEFSCRAMIVMATVLLAGCASTPLQFHSLIEPGLPTPARSGNPAPSIALAPVNIPAQVDMPQLVLRNVEGEVRLLETHRWIAPLAEEIRATLAHRLRADLGAVDVSRIPSATDPLTFRIKIDVQRLETQIGGKSVLVAVWSVNRNTPASALSHCAFQHVQDAGTTPQHHVLSYRRAVDALAAEIALGIGSMQRTPAQAACPTQNLR